MLDKSRELAREVAEREKTNIRIRKTRELIFKLLHQLQISSNSDEQERAKRFDFIIKERDTERFWYLVFQNIQKGYADVGKYFDKEKIDPPQLNTAIRAIEYAAGEYDKEQEIQKLKIDPLTNLPMRSEFVKDFHEMMKNSKDMVCMLIEVDVDGLKLVNDNAGHTGGDTYLVHVADGLQKSITHRDQSQIPFARVYRNGQSGDEFYILLTCNTTNIEQGKEMLRKLVQDSLTSAVDQSKQDDVPDNGDTIRTGLSCGVALFSPTQQLSFDPLLTCADQGGYLAKMTRANGHEVRNKPNKPLLPEIDMKYKANAFPPRGKGRWAVTYIDYTTLDSNTLPVVTMLVQTPNDN